MTKKASMDSLENLCKQMLDQANQLDIAISGALCTPDGTLLGFEGEALSKSENMVTLASMVQCKGDMTEFLCQMSQKSADSVFSSLFSDEEDKALIYAQTNPQVFNTKH